MRQVTTPVKSARGLPTVTPPADARPNWKIRSNKGRLY